MSAEFRPTVTLTFVPIFGFPSVPCQCNPPVGCRHVTHLHLFLHTTLTKPRLYSACLEQTYRQQHNLKEKLYCDKLRERENAAEMDKDMNSRGRHDTTTNYSLKNGH